ncbi:small, acid-soluble spore protein, alpha/beta type [Paenibacillus sp. GCM10012307]|uniref:Alpha/beta-type small acid-soluble spore protein n=1 Tax=Paenibacillus roseus TaxID=2798579 RepID=A0A934ML88_9BACL|nr:alpha/beta-type small acid-soluble spore protein [Paenibacillus roseus]MBJ6361915.1 alpha/beta-type small acid-soluble spore protein [Paenibacillus roseus]
MATRSNKKVVPESRQALDQLKYEIAAELGLFVQSVSQADTEFAGEIGDLPLANRGYVPWSQLATRDAGSVGGEITRRLIAQAEQVLGSIH